MLPILLIWKQKVYIVLDITINLINFGYWNKKYYK